jgi:hypothetical protein
MKLKEPSPWPNLYRLRAFECGCVLALGDVPPTIPLSEFPKCEAWEAAFAGDDLDAFDGWAAKHFEETPFTVVYRQEGEAC